MMAWGHECSLWDDSVDIASLERFNFEAVPLDKSIMTTWHENETLDDVFWFAGLCAETMNGVLLDDILILDITDIERETLLLDKFNKAQVLYTEKKSITAHKQVSSRNFLSLSSIIIRPIRMIQLTLFILFLAGSVFGWHIHTVYRMAVASSPFGEPLFEREVLEDYGRKINNELNAKNVELAIISRAGQKRSQLPDGVDFTHSAFWIREADGQYAVYNLYHGEDNRLISSLVKDSPADFLRLTREHDVGIIIPTGAAQKQIIDYIQSPRYGEVHQVNYSLISNPFDTRFQNCNEYMLDSLAAMFWNTPNSTLIKEKYQGVLKPKELETSFIRRYIGPIVDERLKIEDHGETIVTTTRKTLAQFLDSQGALQSEYIMVLKD